MRIAFAAVSIGAVVGATGGAIAVPVAAARPSDPGVVNY
ncbi:MAG: sensor domain-containing protein, partial [Mycobacterium sp.]|nr:sensor domain-containing protein [Mycobacterium sp.]